MHDELAHHYLADALCEALFRLPGPSRLGVILATVPEDLRAAPAVAAKLLAADPRFVAIETRWDLAHRVNLADRPLGGALELILQAFGRPMPESMLLAELSLLKGGDPEENRVLLARLTRGSREVGWDGVYYYRLRWLANTLANEDQRLLYLNGLEQDQTFIKAQKKLTAASLKGRTVLDTAAAVLKAYGQPLDNRALGLVLWRLHGDKFDAATILSEMLADERFHLLSGPCWIGDTQSKTLEKATAKARGQAELPAAPLDAAAALQTPPTQKLKLTEPVMRAAQQLAQLSRTPVGLGELLEDVMDVRPKSRNYVPAAHALDDLLAGDLRLMRLQRGQYLSKLAIPEWVRGVPVGLKPETLSLGPGEVNPDILLPVEALDPELAALVQAPLYEDLGEAEVLVGEEADQETQIPIPYHHYRLGTMRLRLLDRRLLDVPGPVTVVTFLSPDGTAVPVWVNTETRLLYGLLRWYEEWLYPAGSLLTIRRGAEPEVYELVYTDETDPGTHLSYERLAELLDLRERLRRRRAFLLDIVTELLREAPKGLSFDQLCTQVNIVRRTTRLQVASILSHYEQFSLGSGGRWALGK